MGLSPQERWMCWEISARGVKGRREGKEGEEAGVCLNMQPLWVDGNNIQSTSSLVLPPTEHVVKVETDWESQTIITEEPYQRPGGKYVGMIVVYQTPPTWSVSCWCIILQHFPALSHVQIRSFPSKQQPWLWAWLFSSKHQEEQIKSDAKLWLIWFERSKT